VNGPLRRAALLLMLAGLAACSSLPRSTADGEALSGRLSVAVDGGSGAEPRGVSAAFELSGTPQSGRLDLTNPLGSVMARARWAPGEVVLTTPERSTAYPDLDALTREVLGESLPVAALFDWLRGRPWPGAPSQQGAGAEASFEQLGWAVNLARFGEGWVTARRERAPGVTVRARVDR
jgi:outer membrane lipoprotein LolB